MTGAAAGGDLGLGCVVGAGAGIGGAGTIGFVGICCCCFCGTGGTILGFGGGDDMTGGFADGDVRVVAADI